jgi:hypothetical protein
LGHNACREPFDLARRVPGATDWLPLESTTDLVDGLALPIPFERKVVEVVAEGDQPARQAGIGGLHRADVAGGVGVASPGEEGDTAGSTGDQSELLVRFEDVGHDLCSVGRGLRQLTASSGNICRSKIGVPWCNLVSVIEAFLVEC